MNSHLPVTLTARPHVDAEPKEGVHLRQLQDFIWRRWKLAAVCAVLMTVACAALLSFVHSRYTATAQILLEARKPKLIGDNYAAETSLDTAAVDSQISVVQSFNLLRRVVERENLANDPEFNPPPSAEGPVGRLERWVLDRLGRSAPATEVTQDDGSLAIERLVYLLRARLDVQRLGRTNVLTISITSEDPAKATRLTNALADAYIVDKLEARYDAARTAAKWLTERLDGLREQVKLSEEEVARFRIKYGLESANTAGQVTLSEQQLAELSAKVATASAETAEKRAKFEQARRVQAAGGETEAIPDVVRSSVITQLRTQQAELTRREAELSSRYSSTYPLVVNVRAEKRDLERSIKNEVDRIISNLRNDYDVARAREASLRDSLSRVSGESGLDSEAGIRLRELVRTNEANKTLFENFLTKSKVSQEQSTFEERDARIISQAVRPLASSYPKRGLLISMALMVGGVLGLGLGLCLDLLNPGFETPDAVEKLVHLPVLASVPLLRARSRTVDGRLLDPAQFLVQRPLSHFSEAIRSARVAVQMTDVDHPPRTILVTSSAPGEGKSTIVSSLGFSAAAAGKRVLLIDCDIRRPQLSRSFDLGGSKGLVDVLTSETTLQSVLSAHSGLIVLPAGSKATNPADLLGSERWDATLRSLRSSFDYILLDAPPLNPVVDARVLARCADKIVFVVRWQKTPRGMVENCINLFRDDRKLCGFVFNAVDENKISKYGAYSHYSDKYSQSYFES